MDTTTNVKADLTFAAFIIISSDKHICSYKYGYATRPWVNFLYTTEKGASQAAQLRGKTIRYFNAAAAEGNTWYVDQLARIKFPERYYIARFEGNGKATLTGKIIEIDSTGKVTKLTCQPQQVTHEPTRDPTEAEVDNTADVVAGSNEVLDDNG